jgi:hypothetical protein
MVGRVVKADYRRDLNFLSLSRYTRSRADYSGMRVPPIVGSTTGKYHATVTRQNKSRLRTEAAKS